MIANGSSRLCRDIEILRHLREEIALIIKML